MNILSFGSLNIDYVYRVAHIAREQETLASRSFQRYCGGKGLNQTAAAHAALNHSPPAKMETAERETPLSTETAAHKTPRSPAEVMVFHGGSVGSDDTILRAELQQRGIDSRFVRTVNETTGHAIIQVSDGGENAIIIHGGANRMITAEQINETIGFFQAGDILLLQHEIAAIPEIMAAASQRGMRIFCNAAPCDQTVTQYPLQLVDTLIVNEIEGELLSGARAPAEIIEALTATYPQSTVIVTVGAEGALYGRGKERHQQSAYHFKPKDTTAAGDTFVGYYAAFIAQGKSPEEAMKIACAAASLSITREGAIPSIPAYWEVLPHL